MLLALKILFSIVSGSLAALILLPVFRYPLKEAVIKFWLPVLIFNIVKTAAFYIINTPFRSTPGMVLWQLICIVLIVLYCTVAHRLLQVFKKKTWINITFLVLSSLLAQVIITYLINIRIL